MSGDLSSSLMVGEVDDEELATVIADHFPRQAMPNDNEVQFQIDDGSCALSLHYSSDDDQLVAATRGAALTEPLLERIATAVRTALLVGQSDSVVRTVVFTSRPLEGRYRYGDDFQVLTAPPSAPRPPVLCAQHPAVLEVRYRGTPHRAVRSWRQRRRLHEVGLLLAVVLRDGVDWPDTVSRNHWVLTGTPPTIETTWAQEGYVADLSDGPSGFTDAASEPELQRVQPQKYYIEPRWVSEPFSIPDNVEALARSYSVLSAVDRDAYLRACYWHHLASRLFSLSRSAHYTSLISAIETLQDQPLAQICASCNRDRAPGPTAMFKRFLKTYAPGLSANKQRDQLYGVRSQLVHGHRVLRQDLRGADVLDPAYARDTRASWAATDLVRLALVNWLLERAGEPMVEGESAQ